MSFQHERAKKQARKAIEKEMSASPSAGNTPDPLSDGQILGAEPLAEQDMTEKAQIYIKLPYHELAKRICACIPYGALYRLDRLYVTLHPQREIATVDTQEMTQARFTTWVSQYCRLYNMSKDGAKTETSLSEAMARVVLSSDIFRDSIPEIEEIVNVRLPIMAVKDGKPHFEPAAAGYDPKTKLYSLDSLPIQWDKTYPLDAVRKVFINIFSEFALDGGLIGGCGDVTPTQSPSLAACVCSMLGQFLHHCIDKFPLIIYNANKQGTGKTFLARVCLAPVWGDVPVCNYQSDENELRKTLNSLLFSNEKICLLDDVKTLSNNTLNRYITSSIIKDRELGQNRVFSKRNRMQFFATGNNLKSTADIERRSIPVDLFYARDVKSRKFKFTITEESIQHKAWRADICQGLWSIVKHWEQAGCPALVPRGALPSFDFYCYFAINATIFAGFANPLGARIVNLDTGDVMGHALKEVIIALADNIMADPGCAETGLTRDYTVRDIIEAAEAQHKLDIVTNSASDSKKAMGLALRAIKGNEYKDSWGRWFSVGDRRSSASTLYRFTILSERTRQLESNYPDSTPFD